MLTIEDVKKMSMKELTELETELLRKMDAFGNVQDLENHKWFQEIHNDYVLVSEEIDRIVEADFTDEDREIIAENERMFEYTLLGPDPYKTRRKYFRKI